MDSSKQPVTPLQNKHTLVPAFLAAKGLVKLHIDSYNHFIETEIKNIVRANNRVSVPEANWWLEYNDVYIRPPTVNDGGVVASRVTPHDCRLRDLTYAGEILVDVTFMRQNEIVSKKGILIGRMPVMLKSSVCILNGKSPSELMRLKECPLDPGGYFIIGGTEKVILMQEQISKNRIIIEEDSKRGLVCSVTSTSAQTKSKTNIIMKDDKFFLAHNSFTVDVPAAILFKSMGITSDQEMLHLIGTEESIWANFVPSLKQCLEFNVHTKSDACRWMQSKLQQRRFRTGIGSGLGKPVKADGDYDVVLDIQRFVRDIIITHVEMEKFNFAPRALFLGQMIRYLILANEHHIPPDDRDFYGNKRIELAGSLMALLFEDVFKTFNEDMWLTVSKLDTKRRCTPFDISRHIKTWMITEQLNRAISSGNWIIKRFRMMRHGVTQIVSRLSYVAALGHMTRMTSQFEKTRKVSGPRSIHASQWGLICPSDTPEGEACGLVKNVALMCHVTVEMDDTALIRLISNYYVLPLQQLQYGRTEFIIYVNGKPIGFTEQPGKLAALIRGLRRTGRIDCFVSVHIKQVHRCVHVVSDGGRLCRPYIIVSNNRPLVTQAMLEDLAHHVLSWDDFLKKGVIEYLDANELNDCLVAMDENSLTDGNQYTHMEIDPATILGVVAGLIPYPDHNQSPRNTYQCAMGKQAIGTVALNQQIRFDTLQHQMVYPQKPLVQSKTIQMMHFDELPAGQNAIVAIMSYSGYDVEDALVINRASLDRGFARACIYRRTGLHLKMHENAAYDRLMGPSIDRETGLPRRGEELLQADGTAYVGARASDRQILVNREMPVVKVGAVQDNAGQLGLHPGTGDSLMEFKRCPADYKGIEPSYVEKIMFSTSEGNQAVIKVLLRQTRRPEVGDKFSSRHGQKGVVGLIVRQEDMPFSSQGLVPDIIMNPHGFPSRMTVGKLLELLGSKAGAIEGRIRDGSAFSGDPAQALSQVLIDHGHHYLGKEVLHSGVTGAPLEAYIYFGPVYYQRLKHMVMDKVHARSRGPVTALTRQPTEGRSREGGLRVGEMERDCFIAYGTSQLLVERLLTSSDAYDACVCENCGLLATSRNWCQYCRSSRQVVTVRMPYACKLLFQELMCMRIFPRLTLGNTYRDRVK
ncbi:DNA-directed RNA polymerase subunit beta [Fasciola hepatica]|uniref:DNA-directed RNA polymerase subunit beta n=2 Tax=Fasciola TaxID=6191 RepID=A0A4E0R6J2_FASHE|nr:DNA-directed RNA polymerase subunit beta [Fasciola hepatica]